MLARMHLGARWGGWLGNSALSKLDLRKPARAALVLVATLLIAQAAVAQSAPASARQLGDALRMDETLSIMQREAVQTAAEIAPDLFGGAAPAPWAAAVTALYDPATARAQFDAALDTALARADAEQVVQAQDYLTAPTGQLILTLEITAREALLSADVEAAAKDTWAQMQADPLPASAQRVDLIRQIVAANDLIEVNVMAALNGNLAFYKGLAEAGLMEGMTSDDMLAEVWASEAEVRSDIEDWLYPYLALAYAPLSDQDLRSYIAFSNAPAGQMLNAALFAAFDALGAVQSQGMGLAAGQLMTGQDI
ncbi:MAG: hypothetical protein U5N55_13405 [Cypionkella sp.]|nr:hypothetical protein [Cypionkella sp.]